MQVALTEDQKAFIRAGIEVGRFAREEDALLEALSLWEIRERRRAEILAAVDQAEASFARGEGRRISTLDETVRLADDIKRRGLIRLNSELSCSMSGAAGLAATTFMDCKSESRKAFGARSKRDEACKSERFSIKTCRRLAAQLPIAGLDEAVGEICGAVFPGIEGLLDCRLIFKN